MSQFKTTQASLAVIGLHTPAAEVFWNGQKLLHLVRVRGHSDVDDGDVVIKVNDPIGEQEALYVEMEAAGIVVRRGV